ncbi:MAG: outer membrane protein assembly factor [Gammaproteobacteria bacterium]|nr:outer membrane protein assembly factor [Gammaproteobacteria bacterium]
MPRLISLLVLSLSSTVNAGVEFDVADPPSGLVDNLRARSGLAAEPCDAPAWRVQRLFRRTEQDLVPALQAFGFYGAQIDKRLRRDDSCWHADVAVLLGARTTIASRQINIQGEAADDPQLATLFEELPLAVGAVLNHAEYESIKDRLRQFAAERGYLDFAFTRRELRVNPQTAQADVLLDAESGPRYRFGELRFEQQTLDDDFVQRLAGLREQQPYDARAVAGLDRRLSDAGYFQRVEVRPLRDQADELAVPIEVKLEPARQHAWRAGIGYATDTGPRASLHYDNRYVNRRGHRFESGLSLSPVLSSLTADYRVPGDDPITEYYSFGARLQHEDTDTSISDSALLVAKHTRKVGRWTQNRFVELLHESSEIGDDKTTATLLMPGIGWDRMVADNPLRTRRGYRVNLELRAAHESLLSTATLFRFDANAKGIYRFGDGGRVTGRIDAGSVIGDSIEDLPASLRFFAGGDNSVRGYDYKSLGPLDANDEPRGGRNLLVGSLEYEHPVVGDDWWAAAFVDAGNAFDSDSFDPKVGYGIGARWYSPVGRLRLDIAVPDDTSEDQWRLHFGLGADL